MNDQAIPVFIQHCKTGQPTSIQCCHMIEHTNYGPKIVNRQLLLWIQNEKKVSFESQNSLSSLKLSNKNSKNTQNTWTIIIDNRRNTLYFRFCLFFRIEVNVYLIECNLTWADGLVIFRKRLFHSKNAQHLSIHNERWQGNFDRKTSKILINVALAVSISW